MEKKRQYFPFLYILLLLLVLSSCFRKGHKTLPTPICSIRIEEDSIFVDGAVRDSMTFGIPLSFQFDPPVENDNSDAEPFRQDRLKNPRRTCLQFSEKINGYDVQTIIHPDDNTSSVGMAEWIFEKDGKKLRINTGFSWDWEKEIKGQIKDSIRYEGETHSLPVAPEMVQGRDSIIHDTPFCFKDVDFDGELELCFRCPGYNRHYFNIYKIISPTRAEYMAGRPYNNIIYSDYDNGQTILDYKEQTILVDETSGCCHIDHHLYKRRATVQNVLPPV